MSSFGFSVAAAAAATPLIASAQPAFVAPVAGGFLTPSRSPATAAAAGAAGAKTVAIPQAAPLAAPVFRGEASSASSGPVISQAEGPEAASGWEQYGKAALAASLGGFVASLAARRGGARRLARRLRGPVGGLRVATVDTKESQNIQTTSKESSLVVRSELDDVEDSIAEFVPKISALQSQAELLRSGELKNVLTTMKELRKSELRGVFSEVDQLLCALVDAIDGLRDSAQSIRTSELRQQFERMDRDAKAWVDNVERDAVESLTGYRAEKQTVDTMMEVHVIGLSHHKAPVDVREKLAVPEAEWNKYAQELIEFARTPSGYVIPEVAVLSTCNRFELYFASPELKKFSAIECVQAFLRQKSGLEREELDPYLFTHSGEGATTHLFEVSSGLDSLVLGEAQILAQVKACHNRSIEKVDENSEEGAYAGSGGKIIAKMLNAGIRMGKLVRTRTKIGKGSVSVSSAAVELMMAKSMGDLRKVSNNVHICILGAGKMSRLLLIALFSKNPEAHVTVVNRNVANAQAMLDDELVAARGGKNAKVASMDEMMDVIAKSDVIFAATASKEPILKAADVSGREKAVQLIDISVPRNIGADCSEVENVHSYSVDDLKKVVQANADKRKSEVIKAKRYIGDEVQKFKLWQASQGAVPYLAALQTMAENIRRSETEKMSQKLRGLHEKEREAVDKLTRHIIDQLFRPIYYSMKDNEEIEAKRSKIWALKNMFKLEPEYKRRLLSQGETPAQLNA
mmetsp:Transcript_97971/g.247219  ORF Transcript_97971/g.247219 Transcript_97971/m.247219 type:complete len:744 (+) Transcript_97971:83-2314(+)